MKFFAAVEMVDMTGLSVEAIRERYELDSAMYVEDHSGSDDPSDHMVMVSGWVNGRVEDPSELSISRNYVAPLLSTSDYVYSDADGVVDVEGLGEGVKGMLDDLAPSCDMDGWDVRYFVFYSDVAESEKLLVRWAVAYGELHGVRVEPSDGQTMSV